MVFPARVIDPRNSNLFLWVALSDTKFDVPAVEELFLNEITKFISILFIMSAVTLRSLLKTCTWTYACLSEKVRKANVSSSEQKWYLYVLLLW
jgi:hypothetical protein